MMPDQEQTVPTIEQTRAQVERILRSKEMAGTELLRHLLSFLAEHSLGQLGYAPKEHELAIMVFGRKNDFDARLDSVVRVQAGRLRARLAEYYMGNGRDDSVVIEIPRGFYRLDSHFRQLGAKHPLFAGRVKVWGGWLLSAALTLSFFGFWIGRRPPRLPPALSAFWQPFITGQDKPLVIFTNPRFAGSSLTGLRYFVPSKDPEDLLNLTYSGTGDVISVFTLSQLFGRIGRTFDLKRSTLLNMDETRERNVILIGCPEQNFSARELPQLREFKFKFGGEEPYYGLGGIVNLRPGPGEEKIYLNSGLPYLWDHVVVAHGAGLRPDRHALIIAGTVTYGTLGLVEYLCREESVANLLHRLRATEGVVPYFEALFYVRIRDGVPVATKLKALRVVR